jgi:hypothetical protein
MSAGDISKEVTTTKNYDYAKSSSSESLFNRSFIPLVSPPKTVIQPIATSSEKFPSIKNVMIDEHASELNLHVCRLEEKLNANFYQTQSDFSKLYNIIVDLSNQVHQLKSAVNSPINSPHSLSRPNSHNCINNKFIEEHSSAAFGCPTMGTPHSNHICTSPSSIQMKPLDFQTSNDVNQFQYLQETLKQTNATLERLVTEVNNLRKENDERRDIENHLFKKELDELRCTRPLPGRNSSNTLTPISYTIQPSLQHPHTSAFVPIVTSSQPTSLAVPANTFTTTSIMPFTMSLTNALPSFSGKETEMPTKFITEFEIRASGLVGTNDSYLLRAVQQVLSDTALTWFVQQQQELPITTWSQFKQLFLQRFRTPNRIESLRNRLRILWQGDNEPTLDYFERMKVLVSEIEPTNSNEYLKRKFLQKLRKDIREKMPVGLTSTLSDLLQKAIDIETNIIQYKIDDKLREAQNEENQNKYQSITVNNLFNVPESNSSHLPSAHIQDSYNNYADNYNYNKNQNSSDDKYSNTFIHSATSSFGPTKVQDTSHFTRPIVDRNVKVKSKNNNRWCTFCSSTSHTWFHCYSNPNGPNFQHQYSHAPQNYQQLKRDEIIHQQQSQQHYQKPTSNSYSASQPPFTSPDGQGSRH